jgi:hypothetical protein
LNKAEDFMIDAIFWSGEEVAAKAGAMYTNGIQQQVETTDNREHPTFYSIERGKHFVLV